MICNLFALRPRWTRTGHVRRTRRRGGRGRRRPWLTNSCQGARPPPALMSVRWRPASSWSGTASRSPRSAGSSAATTGARGCPTGGRAQVRALRDRLAASGELAGTSALYSSVMARAAETARHPRSRAGRADRAAGLRLLREPPRRGGRAGRRGVRPAVAVPGVLDGGHPGGTRAARRSARWARGCGARWTRWSSGTRGRPWWSPATAASAAHSTWLLARTSTRPATRTRAWLHPDQHLAHRVWRTGRQPGPQGRRSASSSVRFNDHAHLQGALTPRRWRENQSSTA